MTGIALVIMVPLLPPTTSTDSCSLFSDWRSDPEQAQAQKLEGGRTWLPEPRAAVLKIPFPVLPLLGCNQRGLCPFSGSWNSHPRISGQGWVVLNALSGEIPGSQSDRAALGTQKCCSRYLDNYWTQTLSGLGSSWFTLQFLPAGLNFTSVLFCIPKSSSGTSLSLNTHFPGAKLLSYFHFYLGTIHPLSLSSLELISSTCLCYAVVITLNLQAGFSRLSQA